MTNQQAHDLKQKIQSYFETTLAKELGQPVEVTLRGSKGRKTHWTISGAPTAVQTAAKWLQSKNLMTITGIEYDEELGESFCYMQSN